jgi:glycosyltransferase A (GT-A) superfamily protein (DUF2064 family)
VLLRRAREWAAGVGELREQPDRFPLLIAFADMPRFGRWHAEAPLQDLAEGADAAVGPTLDGGVYLLALAAAQPALVEAARDGGQAVMAAAGEAGLELGLLRPERAVRTADDWRALLADPLLPAEVRAALEAQPT